MLEVFKESFEEKELPTSSKRALLSLLPKKGDLDLENWRPVALLCTDKKSKMAPRMAAVLRAPGKLCSFSYVLFVFFLLFYVLDVVSITVYDRDTLLNIGSSVAQRKPDFEF